MDSNHDQHIRDAKSSHELGGLWLGPADWLAGSAGLGALGGLHLIGLLLLEKSPGALQFKFNCCSEQIASMIYFIGYVNLN